MLGIGLQINKIGRVGGHPPFYSDLLFYSKKRTGSNVVNEIDGGGDGKLVYNPLTDVIDIQDETKYPRGETTTGSGDTLHVWETVTLLTKLDDVIGNKTFKIVKDFNDFQAVDNGRSTTDYYIMASDIDCSKAQTMKETTSSGNYDAETTYDTSGTVITWTDTEGNTDRYIKTPYMTNYVAGKTPSDTDTDGQKYWHIYNYQGFWINEFKGVFSGNGFELQNCYVNKVDGYTGVFSRLSSGKLSNIGVTGSVIGYGERVGGLVGWSGSSSITNSYSTGSVIGYGRHVGGLAGINNTSSIITNSYSTGSVIGYGAGAGGLVGYNDSSSITNSYSTDSVIGYGLYVGGLAGINNTSSTITNSYSTGSVIGYGGSIGGLVGLNSVSTVINSYYDTETSGQRDTGKGEPRTTEQMKDIDNYLPEWDFSNTWAIDDGYPYLRMQVDNLANPISNSRIVNNYDGYILMPSDIEIESGKPLFNRDDTDIYNQDATSVETGYVGDGTGGESSYYWHISELNTATILSYMNNDYKNSWFVKNTFETGTYDAVTVKEILAYDAPITDVDDLSKLMKYLKLNVWYDSQTWDDNIDWID